MQHPLTIPSRYASGHHTFKNGLHSLTLSLLLACNLYPAASAQTNGSATEPSTARIDIPAQPLGQALLQLGAQTDIQIYFLPDTVAHHQAPAVTGQLTASQALTRLLEGTGIGVRWTGKTASLIPAAQAPSTSRDNDAKNSSPDTLLMPNIIVLGSPEENYQGEAIIDRRAIEHFPGANGDMTTLLRMHPSVRFDSTQQSSNTPGEINPADISINGAKFYQNNFMIDGVSINNDLDPGASSGSRNDVNGIYNVPSNAFGIAIDADLLDEVRVYDSNVPVKYGRFNGGVVDAVTRRPTRELHGKISTQMTRSSWTEYHLNGEDVSTEEFQKSSDYTHQPEFKKITTRLTLEGHPTDNLGLIGSVVRKTSEIPLYAYSNGFTSASDSVKRTQKRVIENQMLKGFWTPHEQLDLSFTLINAPSYGDYFKANQRNSNFRIEQGGQSASVKAVWFGDKLTWTQQFSWKSVHSSRDADSNIYRPWRWSSEKNWGNPYRDGALSASATSIEGGMGDIEQRQTGFEYRLDVEAQPLTFLGAEHRLSAGLELRRQKASYEVTEDSWTAAALSLTPASASTSCMTASGRLDDEYCSIGINAVGTPQRQFFRQFNYVRAGKIDVTQNDYALYLQDELRIGRLSLRPGIRIDSDDYMDKTTIAPRFSASYDFFGNAHSILTVGANRYYGRNLFKYRLADGRESLRWRSTRAISRGATIPDFGAPVQYGVDTDSFRRLSIPYDDEWMVGFSQQAVGLLFNLKYVHRDGRDQVVRSRARTLGLEEGNGTDTIANYYTYTNAGSSRSQTISLTVSPLQHLRIGNSATSFQFGVDWNRTRSAYDTYDEVFGEDRLNDEDVYYDGRIVPFSRLPASNFNRPWTARLSTVTDIPALNLTWSNFFRYRGAYKQIYRSTPDSITINNTSYDWYTVGQVGAAFTWDARIQWDLPLRGDQAAYAALTVTNLTNHINDIIGNGGTLSYETGRQYWLEVGYRF